MERERREYVRIRRKVGVDYWFVNSDGKGAGKKMKGSTQDLSVSGIQLVGKLPSKEIVIDLLSRKTSIVMSIKLGKRQVKAIGRAAWIDVTIGEKDIDGYLLGVQFKEIAEADKNDLVKFIIQNV